MAAIGKNYTDKGLKDEPNKKRRGEFGTNDVPNRNSLEPGGGGGGGDEGLG
jgi:hypothetical protein